MSCWQMKKQTKTKKNFEENLQKYCFVMFKESEKLQIYQQLSKLKTTCSCNSLEACPNLPSVNSVFSLLYFEGHKTIKF